MKMRQSTFTKDCLRAVQFTLDNPDVYFGGSKRAVGTGFHVGLEMLYSYRQLGLDDPDVEELLNQGSEAFEREMHLAGENWKWDDDMPDVLTSISYIEKMLRIYVDGQHYWPAEFKVLGTEVRIDEEWHAGHRKTGSVDLVLEDPAGWIIGVDHKTVGNMWPRGKEHPRKKHQGPWYVSALRKRHPEAPGVRFVYDLISWKTGKFERRVADSTVEQEAAADKKALDVTNLYVMAKANGIDLPANTESNLCGPKYCDWYSICPHGSALSGAVSY